MKQRARSSGRLVVSADVPVAIAKRLEREARANDRTVSAELRRLLRRGPHGTRRSMSRLKAFSR